MPTGFAEFFLPELFQSGAKGLEGGVAGLLAGQEYQQKASAAALEKMLKQLQADKLRQELGMMGMPQFQQLTPGAAYGTVDPRSGGFRQAGVAPFPKTEFEAQKRIELEIEKARARQDLELEKFWNRILLEMEKKTLGLKEKPHVKFEERVLEEYAGILTESGRQLWKEKNPIKARIIEDYFAGKERESLAAAEEITTGSWPNVTKRRVTPQQLKQLDSAVAGYVQLFEEKQVSRAQADALLKKPGQWLEKEAIKRAILEYFGR